MWSLECRFGKCPGGAGVRHVLKSRDPQSFEKRQETEICVPTGGVRYLVLNHRGDRCLATWLEQHAWGYVGVDLNTMAQMVHGLSWPSATLAAPEFSGDDAYVVSCHFAGSAWWNDELADPNIPSPGGIRKVGTISVQDIENGEITQHDVFVEVPQGWIPDRPDYSEWYGIWGPEFVSDQEFRIWLPDNTAEILKLPLPERVLFTEYPRYPSAGGRVEVHRPSTPANLVLALEEIYVPSKVLFSVAVIFVFLSVAIRAVFLRPIPEQAAFGRITRKAFKPAGTYSHTRWS